MKADIAGVANALREGRFPDTNPSDLADAVQSLADAVTRPSSVLTVQELRNAAKKLNEHVYFRLTLPLAQTWTDTRGFDPTVSRIHAQALINLGALDDAEKLLTDGLSRIKKLDAGEQANFERLEYEGLLGRIWKQRFVASGDQDALAKAIELYRDPYESNPQRPYWHGINVSSLRARQSRDRGGGNDAAAPVAQAILADVQARYAKNPSDHWLAATASEAYLALDRCDEAELWLNRFLQNPNLKPFDTESYSRQLREIWQADPAGDSRSCPNHLLKIMERHVAQTWKRWSVEPQAVEENIKLVKRDRDAFEKNFTGQGTFSVGEAEKMLAACGAIASVCDAKPAHQGTGFLIAGDLLKKRYGEAAVLVTNAHVVSKDAPEAVRPADARITFQVQNAKLKNPKYYRVEEVLFSSEPGSFGDAEDERLDVTVVRLKGLGQKSSTLSAASELPPVTDKTRAFVIGYPQSAGLRISLHDSALLAIDDAQRRVHYRTPTDPGNSGSPVFDTQFNVIGVHRGGSREMRRLRGQGTYEANEGISLQAIRKLLNP